MGDAEKREEAIDHLIAAGADANSTNGRGSTPLHWSVQDFFTKSIVGKLIAAGANPNILDEGGTPLHYAALAGSDREAAVLLLLAAGADPEMETPEGSPLGVGLTVKALAEERGHGALFEEAVNLVEEMTSEEGVKAYLRRVRD